jgi:hypothetical protein
VELAFSFCRHGGSASLLITHGIREAVSLEIPDSVMCSEIGGSHGGIIAVELVCGFPHELFYGELPTRADYTPLADVAGREVLRGAHDRIVRQGFEAWVSQRLVLLYYYTYYHYYRAQVKDLGGCRVPLTGIRPMPQRRSYQQIFGRTYAHLLKRFRRAR